MTKLNKQSSFFLTIGILLLFFYAYSFLIPVLFLWCGQAISGTCFILTSFLTIGSSFFIVQGFQNPKPFILLGYNLLLAMIVFFSAFVSLQFLDTTYDGQTYHLEAIMSLVKGWNPICPGSSRVETSLWTSIHYPKASWYAASNMIACFETIEIGKTYNLLLLFSSFFISLVAVKEIFNFRTGLTIFLATLISLNPISGNQFLSFYLDGQIASLIIILFGLFLLFFKKWPGSILLGSMFFVVIALINLKFPSLVFAVIFCAGFVLFYLWKNDFKEKLKFPTIFGIVFLIGSFFIGYSPYFINVFEYAHPFYPLNEVHLLEGGNQANNFNGANRFYKLFHSIFSYQGCVMGDDDTVLKNPFIQGVMQTYKFPDTRIGGFGPYFSLIVLFSVFLAVLLMLFKENKKIKKNALYIFLVILSSIIVHPESWWARYIPQLYLVPIVLLCLSFVSKSKVVKYAGGVLLIIMAINQIMLSRSYIEHNIKETRMVRVQLDSMKKGFTTIYLCEFSALRYRLDELDIKYDIVDDKMELPCENAEVLRACTCDPLFCVEGKNGRTFDE